MNKILICLFSSLILLSCMEESETNIGVSQFSDASTPSFNNQTVVCEDPDSCPSYLARVVIKRNGKVKSCAGFLVAPDSIMTTPDCLGANISERTKCDSKIRIFFAKSSEFKQTDYACERIIRDSSYSRKENDLFLIKIKNTKRDIVVKSFNGASNQKVTTVWSIKQLSSTKSKIENKQCTTSYNSLVSPSYNNPKKAKIALGGCALSKSSIGTPVLNEQGKAIAIINKTYSEKILNEISDKFLEFSKKPIGLSEALNFTCLRFLENIWNINTANCSLGKSVPIDSVKNVHKLIGIHWRSAPILVELIQDWALRQTPVIYQWEPMAMAISEPGENTKIDYSQLLVTLKTKCINRPKTWINHFRRTIGGIPKYKEISFSTPALYLNLKFNELGGIDSQLGSLDYSYVITAPLRMKQIQKSHDDHSREPNRIPLPSAVFVRKDYQLIDTEYDSHNSDELDLQIATDKHIEALDVYSPKSYKDNYCLSN